MRDESAALSAKVIPLKHHVGSADVAVTNFFKYWNVNFLEELPKLIDFLCLTHIYWIADGYP